MGDFMPFCTKLKELRKIHGLTQQQLAAKIGMSTSALRMWELGLREPRLEVLTELAKHLGTTVDVLLDADNTSLGIEVKDLKFRKSFEKLSSKGQQEVLDFLEYVRDKEEKLQTREVNKKD